MGTDDRNIELARRFVQAAAARDADALARLYAPDARFWQNVFDRTSTTAEALAIARKEAEIIAEYRFEDQRTTATTEGFVVQTTITGSTHSGSRFRVPVCLVVGVRAGLIASVDEYTDSATVAPILDELRSRRVE